MCRDMMMLSAGMEEMLRAHGFENVIVRPDVMPKYLTDAIEEKLESDGDLEEGTDLAAILYYRVTTKQGSFGFFVTEGYVLDLAGTGLLIDDFYPEDELPLPPDFPPVVPVVDSEQLMLLWQLLVKKNVKP